MKPFDYDAIVSADHSLDCGLIWCKKCGKRKKVDSATCLRNGWPKCCGYTMSLNPPISNMEKKMDDLWDKSKI